MPKAKTAETREDHGMPAPYVARALNPAHPDLANAAGVPARFASERYVESLARIVYYWGYPAVDTFGARAGGK